MTQTGKKIDGEYHYSFSDHLITRTLKAIAVSGGSYNAVDLTSHFIGCNKSRRRQFLCFLQRKGFVTIGGNVVFLTEKGRQLIKHLLIASDGKKSTYTHYKLDPNHLANLLLSGRLDHYLASIEGEERVETFASLGRKRWV